MRARLLLGVVVVSLVASACGGDDDDDTSAPTSPAATGADSSTTDDTGNDSRPGDVDCAALVNATEGLGVAVQVLAQLRTSDQYQLIKDGILDFDPDALLADLETLRALEGMETAASPATVEEVLDTYQEATELTRENLAVDDPFTEAKGDELVALTQDPSEFLVGQASISIAMEEAGCS